MRKWILKCQDPAFTFLNKQMFSSIEEYQRWQEQWQSIPGIDVTSMKRAARMAKLELTDEMLITAAVATRLVYPDVR